MRFSNSMISTWQQCALMAKFSYIDHLPQPQRSKTMFGSIVHAALEYYNRTGDVQGALKLFIDDWGAADPDIWDRRTSFMELNQRGVQIIRDYASQQRWETRKIIGVEHKFLVPFGEHQLSGIVDLLEVKKNHKGKEILRVLDYKTKSSRPTFAELYLNVQGTIYTWSSMQKEFWLGNGPGYPPIPNGEWWYETLKDMPRRFIWYHLYAGQELDGGDRSQVDFDRVYRQCLEIEKAIKAEVYIPTISHSSCSYCAYAEGPCPVKVPTKEEVQEQENAWM